MINPLCCCSLRRGSVRVAAADVILFFLSIAVAVGLECFIFKSTPLKILFFDGPEGEEEAGVGDSLWTHTSHFFHAVTQFNVPLGYFVYLLGLLCLMSYIILEIWLCCVLIRAATEKRPEFCQKWIYWRLMILTAYIGLTGINIAQKHITITDIVFLPLTVYRLYSLIVVFQLKRKLLRSEGKLVF